MLRTFTSLCFCLFFYPLFAQMPDEFGSIRYGNEWIDYERDYLRVGVAEDGMYRISSAQISSGLSLTVTPDNMDRWALYHEGEAVPIEVTPQGIIFYGERNRGEMDRFLFTDPESMQLNDRYSMHNDTAAYFLTLTTNAGGPFYEVPTSTGNPVAVSSIQRSSERVFGDFQSKKYLRSSGNSIYYSRYEPTEGFGSRSTNDLLSPNGATESLVELPLSGADGAEAMLEFRFGLAFGRHNQSISINGTSVEGVESSAWHVASGQRAFTPAGDNAEIRFQGTAGDQDKANLAWVRATYPAAPRFTADLQQFTLPALGLDQQLELTDAGADAGAMKLYSAMNATTVTAQAEGTTAVFILPSGGRDITYQMIRDANDFLTPAATSAHRFSPTLPTDSRTNYLLLTSRRLHGQAVEDFADYRRSPAGGSHRVLVVDVEDLEEEFGYGIRRHPMAVRNYLAAAKLAAPELNYLFLVGKGREYRDMRHPEEITQARATYFLPSFGYPASDNLLSAPLGEVVPQFSTGRLSAITQEEIAIYLRKLRGVEAQINDRDQALAEREWMKQIMHLGGGGNPNEQQQIRNNLGIIEGTIENSRMGANVTSFYKTSSEPIEDSRQEAIFDRINDGTAIITFYGHSSSQGFDFSIDDPNNYFNKDRYPFMLSLGCYSGDAFTEARSISERFIFLRDKGAIAFAASKGLGYISALKSWADDLYGQLGNDSYGQGIGDAMRANIDNFSSTNNFTLAILLEQFSLSGDPAYRMHPQPGPDLVVDPTTVRFTPEVVPAQNESYLVDFDLVNIGNTDGTDTVSLLFQQQLPSGEVIDLKSLRVAKPSYRNTLSATLPNPGLSAVGQNRIFITVDHERELRELPNPAAENNNTLRSNEAEGVPLIFIANTAKTAFPPEYAVISGDLELKASTTNAAAAERDYVIQVSSRKDYADLLATTTISQTGGVIRYRPEFTPQDSATYYWRISPDSAFTEGAGYIWDESSFTWAADHPADEVGWAMADPGQTIDGKFDNIQATPFSPAWNYSKTVTDIRIFNALYQSREMPRLMFNSQRLGTPFRWHVRSGIQVIVIDSITSDPGFWVANPGGGAYGAATQANLVWSFDTKTETGRLGLIRFLQEAIEPGKYVYVYSAQRGSNVAYFNENWVADEEGGGTSIMQLLEAEGATQIRSLTQLGSVPYAFAFQKGIGPINEVIAQTVNDTIVLETQILSNWNEGQWQTTIVGPATEWENASLRFAPNILPENDSLIIRLKSASPNEPAQELLTQTITPVTGETINFSLIDIDPEQYPYLQAEIDFFDNPTRTVPAVALAAFDYKRPGDAAVSPNVTTAFPDSVFQGQTATISVDYSNLSPTPMDSLLVLLEVTNAQNQTTTYRKRYAPLAANGSGNASFEIATEEITEDFRFRLVLNPGEDQPELVKFNNSLIGSIKVIKDNIDPIANIYFDGRNIQNGELVSSSPEIMINLRDENRFLPVSDTQSVLIELLRPNGNRERLRYNSGELLFTPATADEPTASILYTPDFIEDGTYQIEVLARDASGNLSGRLVLSKQFEIVTAATVANVLPYPNPFTTKTNFVYTLTGSDVPEVFRIQIMTVSGRVVRDIDLTGENLKIGTHQTTTIWDGTDQYGDQLANGVYLYRVITADKSGENWDKATSNTDQYFRNGLGKVVILR